MSGNQAERLAKILLVCKGYKIINSNYVTGKGTGAGEIDIIAKRFNTLIFVEVKKRKDIETSLYAISELQKKRISRGIEAFLKFNPKYSKCTYRIDAILVAPSCKIVHIKNAWLSNEDMYF